MSETRLSKEINGEALKLPPVLDLAAANGLIQTLRERRTAGTLYLDASEVEVLTYPGVQMVLAMVKDRAEISIASPSAAFVSVFQDLGIALPEISILPVAGAPKSQQNSTIVPELTENSNSTHAAEPIAVNGGCHVQSTEGGMVKRILTIDDSKTMRDMLMLTLADAGFDVVQAVDGQDGLEVLGREKVDVIITDINMPRMDGYEVIRRLRDKPEFKKTPILVLTTESELAKKNLAREVGATGWMVKPFDPDRLVATVRKVAN